MKKLPIIILFVIVVSLALMIQLTDAKSMVRGDQVTLPRAEYYQLIGTQERFQKLLDLEHEIQEKYYQDPSEIDFDTALYRGLFGALDKYSTYFTADEYNNYTTSLSGEFVGIGAMIESVPEGVKVVQPFKDGPAERAGILAGDIIWKVDEAELAGLSSEDSAALMKGEAGTPVVIHVKREAENLEFKLIRAKVTSPSVFWELRENIGYVRLAHFEQPTANQFRQAMTELRQENIQGLVIDLRSNPGGYLHSVVDVAEQILGRTTVVTEVSRTNEEKVYASKGGHKLDIPYVVLVNQYSASASEILAAAIQDTESAKIIGETTTGKGVVQTAYRLKDGSGFKITTARYLTPSGRDIHGTGVEPDISLEMVEEAGFSLPEKLRFGAEDDGVLNYALDLIEAMIALK